MRKFIQTLATWATEQFMCIYGCGFGGTYNDVQAHQSACPDNYNRR